MIIYEVNLVVRNEIRCEYEIWLSRHIKEMLQNKGFIKAMCYESMDGKVSQSEHEMTVHYWLEDEESLRAYLSDHAPAMRQQTVDKFGQQFSATRRMLRQTRVIGA